jgi:hypothetical protein
MGGVHPDCSRSEKDNNDKPARSTVHPALCQSFFLDDIRKIEFQVIIEGEDRFLLYALSSLFRMSIDPLSGRTIINIRTVWPFSPARVGADRRLRD